MMNDISVVESVGVSILGIAIVFLVLVVLMAVIYIMTAVTRRNSQKAQPAAASAAVAAPAPAPAAPAKTAKGSCGEVMTFSVPDRTAAMVMAIVASELDAPLNELRFISIKEVEEESK